VQENITIEIAPSETIKAVTIYDVGGKLLIQSTAVTNKIILNISELSFGYYFVKVQSSLSHYVSKIMID
jgi:hypothetical protein